MSSHEFDEHDKKRKFDSTIKAKIRKAIIKPNTFSKCINYTDWTFGNIIKKVIYKDENKTWDKKF